MTDGFRRVVALAWLAIFLQAAWTGLDARQAPPPATAGGDTAALMRQGMTLFNAAEYQKAEERFSAAIKVTGTMKGGIEPDANHHDLAQGEFRGSRVIESSINGGPPSISTGHLTGSWRLQLQPQR
jgi:hypothetical protein